MIKSRHQSSFIEIHHNVLIVVCLQIEYLQSDFDENEVLVCLIEIPIAEEVITEFLRGNFGKHGRISKKRERKEKE